MRLALYALFTVSSAACAQVQPLTAQDSAAILKLARGLAIPGDRQTARIARVRGDTAIVDVGTDTALRDSVMDVQYHRMTAVRKDGRWQFATLEPVSMATLIRLPVGMTPEQWKAEQLKKKQAKKPPR